MKTIGARRTELLLPYDALIAELMAVLDDAGKGRVAWLERSHLASRDGTAFFSMLACDRSIAIHKLVSAQTRRPVPGVPTVNGIVTVCEAHSGLPVMSLDGPVVTARRTAAVSALAVQWLLPGATSAWLVGAGSLGRAHVDVLAVRGIRRLVLQSRTPGNAQRLAQYGRTLGLQCEVLPAGAQPPAVDLVVTVTSSTEPVLERLDPSTRLVIAVGAFRPDMAELTAGLVRGARGLFVDTLIGARREAGDLIQAAVDWEGVVELPALARHPLSPLDDGYRIFKSVGHSLWDLAAARVARRAACDSDVPEETMTCIA